MSKNTLSNHPFISAVISAAVALPMVFMFYFMLEPTVVSGQSTEEIFVIEQEIIGEVSFVAPVADVEMEGTVLGLTGGTAVGSTTFAVNSNSPSGYTVTIQFENPSQAMQYSGGGAFITNLGATVRTLFEDGVDANEARFGFTVEGVRVAQEFGYDGSCNQEGEAGNGINCWLLPDTTTPFTIVDGEGTASEEEHILHFKVVVEDSPNPSLPSGMYHATATLTVAEKN